MSAIRLVAWFEAIKGLAALLVASGLLSLLHRDLHQLATKLVEHAHLNPAAKYPKIFLDAATSHNDPRLVLLAVGAAAYALIRLVEAYGLYRESAWAEVLAAGSGAVYVPFEVFELIKSPSVLGATLLALNLGVVGFMLRALGLRRSRDAASAA